MAQATCPACGAVNRLPASPRARCGKCKREFTASEVMHATLGTRPDVPLNPTTLDQGADNPWDETGVFDEEEEEEDLEDELEADLDEEEEEDEC